LALPIWIAYQTGEQTATRANFKRMFDAAGAQALVYVVNCTTSTPAAEVAKIQDLITRGFPLTHIELGNELFFNLPYYTGSGAPGSPKYLRGHTSANAYMIDMRDNYVPALRTAFGTTYEIGIPIIPTDSLTGSRENEWSSVAKSSGLDALIDFYAVHPYYTIDDLGVQKADVGNASRAGVIGKNAYKALLTVLRRASLAVFGETAKFLVTEFNVLEDQSQTGKVVIGQSWIHALIQCMNVAVMMRDRRIDMALVHSMLGNAQWSGLVGQDGTNVDGTKRGIADSPFTAGISTPLSPTLSGFAMGLMQNLALSGGGAGTLIADEEGFIGWRINGPTRDACFVINATDETKTLAVPAGKSWAARRWQNNPWLTVTATSQVPSSVNVTAAGGSNLAIPAFSLVVLTGIGGVVVPPAVYDVDFLNFQTSLPDVSWYKSPNAITTFAVGTGMTVSRNPENGGFHEAYVISPAFTPQQGQIIEIDFIGAGGTAGSNDA
jgi:hypothetical protein